MADERKYYVICQNNCKFESMTKEQILAAITQAVETGEIHDVDAGFVTKIKEQNSGKSVTFWVGTTAEYNAIEQKAVNCFYIVTDDTTADDIKEKINELTEKVEAAEAMINAPMSKKLYAGAALPTSYNSSFDVAKLNDLAKYRVLQVFINVNGTSNADDASNAKLLIHRDTADGAKKVSFSGCAVTEIDYNSENLKAGGRLLSCALSIDFENAQAYCSAQFAEIDGSSTFENYEGKEFSIYKIYGIA